MILKSQLDTVCKKLKEKRKLVEMYSNLLKDKKQHDNTTQADLVCVLCSILLMVIIYNILISIIIISLQDSNRCSLKV